LGVNHTAKQDCKHRLAIQNLGTLFLECPEVTERPDLTGPDVTGPDVTVECMDMCSKTLRRETISMGLEIMGLDG